MEEEKDEEEEDEQDADDQEPRRPKTAQETVAAALFMVNAL